MNFNLEHIQAYHSDDGAKVDMELVCTRCDENDPAVLCDIESGDTMTVLVAVAADHNRQVHGE